MNKEEILAKSRKENKDTDLFEKEVVSKACTVGTYIGWVAVIIALAISGFLTHRYNFSVCFVFFAVESGIFITKYTKLRKIHELLVSILYVILAILSLVLYILHCVGIING